MLSPPAPACWTVMVLTGVAPPRSTCHHLVLPVEHHLSLVPPDTLPLTALAGPSLLLQAAEPVC